MNSLQHMDNWPCSLTGAPWMDGWMDGWTDACMDGWMHGWLHGWMREWMERDSAVSVCSSDHSVQEVNSHPVDCIIMLLLLMFDINHKSRTGCCFSMSELSQVLLVRDPYTSSVLYCNKYRQVYAAPLTLLHQSEALQV